MKIKWLLSVLISLFLWSVLVAGTQEQEFLLCTKKDSTLSVRSIKNIHVPKKPIGLLKSEDGQKVLLKTSDGYEFPAIFFDRGKDKVVVYGQGFPGSKEAMLPEASLFDECDAIIFDYRWYDLRDFLLTASHWFPLGASLIGKESEEVITVLHFLQSKKKYKEIIGLGQCYSCYTFLRAQYIQEKRPGSVCFSKLILDSCWPSLFKFTKSLQYDPMLSINPQDGGTYEVIKSLLALPGVSHLISGLLYIGLPNISLGKYLTQVRCQKLFLHGSDDLLIPYETAFLPMFAEYVSEEQALAIVMPAGHVSLSTSYRDFYKAVCTHFIEGSKQRVVKELVA